MNVIVHSPTRVSLSSESYILSMADCYVPDWRQRALVHTPMSSKVLTHYDEAHSTREQPRDAASVKRYGGKVGALVYTSPCVRADTCASISRLARALTFPTPELEKEADQCIVYLAQTASMSLTFDGHALDATRLVCYSDSDWAVGHSTTGYACHLAGASFAWASKRQMCITASFQLKPRSWPRQHAQSSSHTFASFLSRWGLSSPTPHLCLWTTAAPSSSRVIAARVTSHITSIVATSRCLSCTLRASWTWSTSTPTR